MDLVVRVEVSHQVAFHCVLVLWSILFWLPQLLVYHTLEILLNASKKVTIYVNYNLYEIKVDVFRYRAASWTDF